MKILSKAFNTCFSSLSSAFKKILFVGLCVFLGQQLLSGIFNIWYAAEDYMHMDLKNLADICFSGSYRLITIVILFCIGGNYVREGFGPKN